MKFLGPPEKLGLGHRKRHELVPDQLLVSQCCLRWVGLRWKFNFYLFLLFTPYFISTHFFLTQYKNPSLQGTLELSPVLQERHVSYITDSLTAAGCLAFMVPAFAEKDAFTNLNNKHIGSIYNSLISKSGTVTQQRPF